MSGGRASNDAALAGGRLAALLRAGSFAVTGEIVPPRGGDGTVVAAHARALVGSIDAVNVTDNPTASAHMSAVAGSAFVARAGIEPTLQITCRDRNRLAITGDLLGAWALGARNVLCLTGDPMHVGDEPHAATVADLTVLEVVRAVRRLREEGVTSAGQEVSDPPRYAIGVAEMPLADPYDPARLEAKLDAGADLVWTQIAYDVEGLEAWAEGMRARGVFERASVLVGLAPLRSAAGARFMDEKLPGVRVPPAIIEALEAAGPDAAEVGLERTVDVVQNIREIDGISGLHLMGLGHDEAVRAVVERAGLFPRPTGAL
ncbi:MAG: methylenetetrahydrofolate reductase [Actinomycetota bacterium]|nr:methylenetetrahydrofolate reductase [Actinomycetota bacterium]MDH5223506.1 methylenetetrahydrofolate reductase [Actinomycetota bacterium]MDH5313355.1 methylenetetrahydrofolate reductase [Actinomycetota bacterium]